MENFDYVIVGGGSSGSVLANRLGASGASVCVLEAGPADTNPFISMPAGFVKTLQNPEITWRFETEGSEGTKGRRVPATQGRTLGGSGSVNGMVYIRGQRMDFDGWAAAGNEGWGYADVLPYFKQFERRIGVGDDRYRGRDGELPVTDATWRHPLCDAFISAAHGLGCPLGVDYNGSQTEGTGYYQRVIEGERRVSAARAFLRPAMNHRNVVVRTNVRVTQVVLEGRRATGVRVMTAGFASAKHIRANREVIVCAGALNTPKVLQHSGIGPATLLQSLGIAVNHALAGVGENLSDHYSPRVVARVKNVVSINELVRGGALLREALRWWLRKPSVLGMAAAVSYAFGRSEPSLAAPDFTIICTPASYKAGKLGVLDDYPGVTCGAWQMRPESRGYVRIRNSDPLELPAVQPNYLQSEVDQAVLLAALRSTRRILASSEFLPYLDTEILPGAAHVSDAELLDFARQFGTSSYHYAGTCKMGPASDPLAVVDAELRVHGLHGLRIVDASVMPAVTSGNTYAPTLMIANKAADMILARPALPRAEFVQPPHHSVSDSAGRKGAPQTTAALVA